MGLKRPDHTIPGSVTLTDTECSILNPHGMGCCWFFLETGTTRVFRVVSCTTAKAEPQRLGPNGHHGLQPEEGTTEMKNLGCSSYPQ